MASRRSHICRTFSTGTQLAGEGPHLQDSFGEKDHLFASLFDDEILNLQPLFALTPSASDSEMNLPDSIFLVTRSPRYGFVSNISDQIVERWRMRRWRIEVYQRTMSTKTIRKWG